MLFPWSRFLYHIQAAEVFRAFEKYFSGSYARFWTYKGWSTWDSRAFSMLLFDVGNRDIGTSHGYFPVYGLLLLRVAS